MAQHLFAGPFFGEMPVRVLCSGCGEKAQITKTHRLSVDACDLYCICQNCGHRFVWKAGYSHSIDGNPKEKIELIKCMFESLGEGEKRDLALSILQVCS